MNSTNMKRCPHCDSKDGYYTKDRVSGTVYTKQNFDGSEAANYELYDSLNHKSGKVAYCISCNKRLFKIQ